MNIADDKDELFEDLDFMEQPGPASTPSTLPWLFAGAVVGLGVLFLLDSLHGEKNRTNVKRGCTKLGQKCKDSLGTGAQTLRDRLTGTTSGIQREIRAHAPPYLQ